MNPISLCMVVHNAEKDLYHCLNRCRRYFSEIIIVDDLSLDQTVELAKEFTPHVFKMPRAGFCEPYRQLSLDLATNEWAFVLDADECPDDSLLDALPRLITMPYDLFIFNRISFLQGLYVEEEPNQTRLLRRTPEMFWSNRIHTHPQGFKSLSPVMLNMALLHFRHSVGELEEKESRYKRIIDEWLPYWDNIVSGNPPLLKMLESIGCPVTGAQPYHRIDHSWVRKERQA